MNKCVLSWGIAIFLVLGIALQSSWKAEPIDTSTWDVPQLINHLRTGGLSFEVVPAPGRQDRKLRLPHQAPRGHMARISGENAQPGDNRPVETSRLDRTAESS